ncbi:IEV morphogenesis [Sea otter poxvirus]|uniref:IEV morphogenesis n=1 Tax=Sea otter poxvirus TaxID=1416741 RepID=A0A2U9QHJ3_9POXV|nr:IEV morphogenesis [Sea otter poxvirus]AWU47071.1 IEV morphogenesis [Sea otter poxvirus]
MLALDSKTMLNVRAIRDAVSKSHAPMKLSYVFRDIRFDDIQELIMKGLHPRHLSRKFYTRIIESLPHKLYLFKPQHVKITDLFMVLYHQTNVSLYEKHIEYYQVHILRSGTIDIITRCIPYMLITDDDIRFLMDRFPDNCDDMITTISVRSIQRISYLFTDEMAHEMILNNPDVAEALYDHQLFSEEFLWDMHFSYGIVPANKGIDSISLEDLKHILAGVLSTKDAIRLLSNLPKSMLSSIPVKTYILSCIIDGEKLENYVTYAKDYLKDHGNDVGVYVNIMFPEQSVDIDQYNLTRTQLVNICRFIDSYSAFINSIATLLISHHHYDLLATIVDKVPISLLTETVCIQIVKCAQRPVKLQYIPVHNIKIAEICVNKQYTDMVDLLDTLDVSSLISVGANLFTEYTFTTNWFNDNHDLLLEYITQFGFCPIRMKRLMFDYPLNYDAINYLLDMMVKDTIVFGPKITKSLEYAVCAKNLSLPNIRYCIEGVISVPLGMFDKRYSHEYFKSNYSTELKMFLQASNIPNLKSVKISNICRVSDESMDGLCIQYVNNMDWNTEEERLQLQIFDIITLATYGLFTIPTYTPNWVPVVNALSCTEIPDVTVLKGDITQLNLRMLHKIQNLGTLTTSQYNLKYPLDSHHAAINSLLTTIVAYLTIGCIRYVNTNHIKRFVHNIVLQYCEVLKSDEDLLESIHDVVSELIYLKQNDHLVKSDVIVIPRFGLKNTVALATKLVLILYNNTSNKFI